MLQDPGLAFHPPLLYLGYVGFSIAYSFAIAALLEGRVDAAWARWVRPWTLAAWCSSRSASRWALVGLLHPGLGRLLVLGSRRERAPDAVARRHRAAALRHRHGEARRAEGWTVLLAILTFSLSPARHLPGALGRAHLGACLRQRSGARHRSSSRSWSCSPAAAWRSTRGARRSCARRAVCADQPRRRAGPQQPASCDGGRDGAVGTLYPLLLESLTGAKVSVGAAVLQPDLRAALVAAVAGAAVRSVPRLEARRHPRGRQRLMFAAMLAGVVLAIALATLCRGPILAPFGRRARRLPDRRRRHRSRLSRSARLGAARRDLAPAHGLPRPPSAPRSPMPAWRCSLSASLATSA